MSDESYPCFTISQMAKIPDDVLPDFLAELPDMLRHARQIEASAMDLGEELRACAPMPLRLLPLGFFVAIIKSGIRHITFKNDKLGTITLKARVSERGPVFYSRTEPLAAASGTEAQRATTVEQGVVHDGPVAKPDAKNTSTSPLSGDGE